MTQARTVGKLEQHRATLQDAAGVVCESRIVCLSMLVCVPSEELALQLELAEELGNACRASSLEKNCWLCGSLVVELVSL